MTGEITLHGRVTAIGGLREKTMAAYLAGVRTIVIPKDNEKDIQYLEFWTATEFNTPSEARKYFRMVGLSFL